MATTRVRLDKLLSQLGLTTRGSVRKYIHKNEVMVNGKKPNSPRLAVLDSEVTVAGKPLEYSKPLTIMLHKPVGYVCSRKKEAHCDGRTIYDLLPQTFVYRRPFLVSAGRLDRWASGLLIMSQDGSLIDQLATPKRKRGVFGKVYEVKVLNRLNGTEANVFAAGNLKLLSESKPCKPAKFEVINEEEKLVRITLYEGRYHQVRRMLAAVGNKVVQIKRISTGPFHLGDLPEGGWREISHSELEASGLDLSKNPELHPTSEEPVASDDEGFGEWEELPVTSTTTEKKVLESE